MHRITKHTMTGTVAACLRSDIGRASRPMRAAVLLASLLAGLGTACGGAGATARPEPDAAAPKPVLTGADHIDTWLDRVEGKRVAVVANHTAVITRPDGSTVALADSLLRRGIQVACIMAPEHGYQGTADAGAAVSGSIDRQTHVPVHSLYGANRKPRREWMDEADVVVYDMQDVGARFYTYLSTLCYVVQACGECQKPLIVLDRPNPNDTIDGPVLTPRWQSFVGMLPIPVVHGCTLGELALMMVGERWELCADSLLTVVPCSGWRHGQPYALPIAPSPNLPTAQAVALYPSLCLFEATQVSVGRGTELPFQCYGHPDLPAAEATFSFMPRPRQGAQHPPCEGRLCRGYDLRDWPVVVPGLPTEGRRRLGFSLAFYLTARRHLGAGWVTSPSFFHRLAGDDRLLEQIEHGLAEADIRATWQSDLERYRAIRHRYLLYDDPSDTRGLAQ